MPYHDIGGTRLYYELAGHGRPAFVFVHGGMCSHRDWAHQVAALAPAHAVLTLDLAGHGLSGGAEAHWHVERWAADVNALIDALALAPVVLTGHSLASRIVAEAAYRRPDNVAALVLLDGSRTHGGFSATAFRPDDAPPPALDLAGILDATIGPYAAEAPRRAILDTMTAASPALMAAAVAAMKQWDEMRADRVFAGLSPTLPLLAIQSTYHDRFTPRRSLAAGDTSTPYLDFVTGARPDARVAILPATGHFSMIERAGDVTALIRDFGVAAFAAREEELKT